MNVCTSSSALVLIILLRDLYKQINAHDHTKGQIDHMIRAGFIQSRRQIYQSIEIQVVYQSGIPHLYSSRVLN